MQAEYNSGQQDVLFQRLFWWLLAGFGFSLFYRLGAAPVYILDEAKNAQCAREMWYSGQWIVPTFNGELRTDKPPLHYWFMSLSFSWFGQGAWQARFFSAIFGVATVAVTWFFVQRFISRTLAFFAALSLALSTHVLFEFRLAVPDPYLIFFSTAGLFSGFAFLEEKKWGWLLLSAVALALATLAKGPVALGLPGICLLARVIMSRQWWVLRHPGLVVAALLYAAIAMPWYILVHRATAGAFTRGFFLEHNISRFSGEMEGHGGPFYVTLMMVLVGMLPFSLHLAGGIKAFRRHRPPALVSFSLLVSAAYVFFFSISRTKLPNYAMPCYPFLAVGIAYVLQQIYLRRLSWPGWNWAMLGLIYTAIPVAAYLLLGKENETLAVRHWAWPLLVLPLAAGVSCWQYLRKGANTFPKAMIWLAGGVLVFNVLLTAYAYPAVYRLNPVSSLQPVLLKAGHRVVAYKDYNPAFLFNTPDPGFRMQSFADTSALAAYCRKQDKGMLVITRTDKLSELSGDSFREVARYRDLFEIPTTILLEWQIPEK